METRKPFTVITSNGDLIIGNSLKCPSPNNLLAYYGITPNSTTEVDQLRDQLIEAQKEIIDLKSRLQVQSKMLQGYMFGENQ